MEHGVGRELFLFFRLETGEAILSRRIPPFFDAISLHFLSLPKGKSTSWASRASCDGGKQPFPLSSLRVIAATKKKENRTRDWKLLGPSLCHTFLLAAQPTGQGKESVVLLLLVVVGVTTFHITVY